MELATERVTDETRCWRYGGLMDDGGEERRRVVKWWWRFGESEATMESSDGERAGRWVGGRRRMEWWRRQGGGDG